MEADTTRKRSLECQLLIVKAAKAAYNSIKDTEGATLPVKHELHHMSLLSAVTGGCA